MEFFSYSNENISYHGKWQEKNGAVVSYGTVTFADTVFLGGKLIFKGDCDGEITLIIDGGERKFVPRGENEFDVSNGRHTLCIKTEFDRQLAFYGIYADKLENPAKKPYIKFIGDSITNANPGFTEVTASALDAYYSNDSVCGMSLVDTWGWPLTKNPRYGMETHYFNVIESDKSYTPYEFRFDSEPDKIVVFLGTNDYMDSKEDKDNGHIPIFAKHYSDFIVNLSEIYKKADFYIFEPLSDRYCRKEGIEAAFAIMKEKLGNRVTLLDTDLWHIILSEDGTHPAPEGYMMLGKILAARI